jgi:thiamine pyrophosphokinase
MCYTAEKNQAGKDVFDMERCFLFSAGTFYGLRERPAPGDLVIAADAGYRTCQQLGIVPDLLVGDFDSMPQPADFPNVLRVPVEKDDTDTMLAAKEGLRRGCTRFFLYGATGGRRLDHTLSNLQTALYLRSHGGKVDLYDQDFVYTAICGETLTIPRTVEWGLLSVFCMGPAARGVEEEGVQYPLHDAVLEAGFPLGVSNHIISPAARVTVREGMLLVGWQLPPLEGQALF